MDYKIEELLPILEKLTFQYTSGDSTSITYETARNLMEAIIYCIDKYYQEITSMQFDNNEFYKAECDKNDYEKKEGKFIVEIKEKVEAEIAYKLGLDAVIGKVLKAKELYNEILEDFRNFGCRILEDTILDGIPVFFLRYDPKFKPQDHLLTLDYPTVRTINGLCGIDAVYLYLQHIKIENNFLKAFANQEVEQLLERVMPDYKKLYYDNIAYAVLIAMVGCMIANKSVGKLHLTDKDLLVIEKYFKDDNVESASKKITALFTIAFKNVFHDDGEMERYFYCLGNDYAVRILNGIKCNSLHNIFYV